MSNKADDPEYVLVVLNSLGFINVTAEMLKMFMKQLKMHRKLKKNNHDKWKEKMKKKIISKNRIDLEKFLNKITRDDQNYLPESGNVNEIKTASDKKYSVPFKTERHHEIEVNKKKSIDNNNNNDKSSSFIEKTIKQIHQEDTEKKIFEISRKYTRITIDHKIPDDSRKEISSSSRKLPYEKSADQSNKIFPVDKNISVSNKTQQNMNLNFESDGDTSDSYKQLPVANKKTSVKNKFKPSDENEILSIENLYHDNSVKSNSDLLNSYQQLPTAINTTAVKNKFNAPDKKEIHKIEKTNHENFNENNLDLSDSYKQLPEIKPRDQQTNKSVPSQQIQSQRNNAERQSNDNENLIDSNLNYSDFYGNLSKSNFKSSSLERVSLNKTPPEQYTLRDIRERSHLSSSSDSDTETDSSYQQFTRATVKKTSMTNDKAAGEKSHRPLISRGFNEVSNLRYGDASTSESNDSYQQIPDPSNRQPNKGNLINKSQSSAHSAPDFKERSVLNFNSDSKSSSEPLSQSNANKRKEENTKIYRKPTRSEQLKRNDIKEHSVLEY
ncbi:uncharacterized protein LOC130668221 [Microplitis mediator]|uniref:uncharacterized protein LOC130668221 n=1 Tax=Microplitis mediator TaxID=375433 RepID=UPI0025556190|nr:uncharacterized protein LOC130668221 [Microplitis mediator]